MTRLNRWILFLAAGVGLALIAAPALAGPGHINFMFGQKVFDEIWDPIDKQSGFGVEGAFGPGKWPVQMAAYLYRSSGDESASYSGTQFNLDATTYEFGFGLNKTFTVGKKLYPYIGAGGVHAKVDVTAQQSGTSASDHGSGFGFWAGTGVYYRVGSTFNIGGAARYSTVDVEFNAFTGVSGVPISGGTVDAGGLNFGVLVGWGWPKTP